MTARSRRRAATTAGPARASSSACPPPEPPEELALPTRSSERLHASAVAIDGRAVLIEGPSGSGKSDLALRLIDRGATLIADDAVLLSPDADRLVAAAPDTIVGQIEVRGVGIVTMPHADRVPVGLLVGLGEVVERMPEPRHRRILGVDVPMIALDPHEPSAPIKVELALRAIP